MCENVTKSEYLTSLTFTQSFQHSKYLETNERQEKATVLLLKKSEKTGTGKNEIESLAKKMRSKS